LKYKCDVHKKLGELPPIRCYPGQLNQVFLNLLVNAAQAIEERGDITIETRTLDGHIVIRISDTGRGMPPEHLSRIFQPFFTTKAVGKGTGLGLAISHGIIQKHHGTIDVESEPGKGTTFTIRLPVEGIADA
jgi:signal transduction histidine kinase